MLGDSWEGMGYMLIFLVLCIPGFLVWSWWDDYQNKQARKWIEENDRKKAQQRALEKDDL